MNTHFDHYISLGYFCSVAMDLERIGLRSASYPFDWLVTGEMEQIMSMIEGHFEGFLDEADLIQKTDQPEIYINNRTGFFFVHDFDGKRPLHDQLPEVRIKFDRRIERFYRDITEPTLFVRYISDEGNDDGDGPADLVWTERHYDHILSVLRKFNPANDIIWIANSSIHSDVIPHIYTVERDEGDTVARRPMDKNADLYEYLMSFDYPARKDNLKVYHRKERKRRSPVTRLINKLH